MAQRLFDRFGLPGRFILDFLCGPLAALFDFRLYIDEVDALELGFGFLLRWDLFGPLLSGCFCRYPGLPPGRYLSFFSRLSGRRHGLFALTR